MSSDTNKKRSRILAVQKKNLVSLIQNFFIRTVGHHSNINFEEINSYNWEVIASILNSMGPHKSANQWKNTLYYMKNRIRKKVALIHESGGSIYDNLSDLDVKIYEMLPTGDFGVAYDFDDNANVENERNDFTASGNQSYSDVLHEQIEDNSNELSEEQTTVLTDFDVTDDVESGRTLTVQTLEELESFTQNAVIEEDWCPESTSSCSMVNDVPDHVVRSEQTQFIEPSFKYPLSSFFRRSSSNYSSPSRYRPPSVQHTTFIENPPSTSRLHSTHHSPLINRSTSMYRTPSTENSPSIDRREAASTNPSFTVVRPPSVDPPFAEHSSFLDHPSSPQPNLCTDRPASTNRTFTIVRPPSVDPPLGKHAPFLDRPSTPQANVRIDHPASTNPSSTVVRPPSVDPPFAEHSTFFDRPSSPQFNLRTHRPVSTNCSFTVVRPPSVDPPLGKHAPFLDRPSTPQANVRIDHPASTNPSSTVVRPPSVDPPFAEHSPFLDHPSSPQPNLCIDRPASTNRTFTIVRPPSVDPPLGKHAPFLDRPSTPQANVRIDHPASTNPSSTVVRPPSVDPPFAEHSTFFDRPSSPQFNLRTHRPVSTNRPFTIVRPPSVVPPLAEHSPFLDRPSSPQIDLRPVSTNRSFTGVQPPSVDPPLAQDSPFLDRPLSIDRPPPDNTQNQHEGFTQSSSVKTNVRIPEIQKERLVQLVQGNFLKAVGRFAGSNGAAIKANVWQTFTKELNTLGPPRSAEQWKTTFNTIKSSAKAKLADAHNSTNGSAGKALTRLEEKIISIYGLDSMDGQQTLGESGFKYNKSIPLTRQVESGTSNRLTVANAETLDDDANATVTNDESVFEDIIQEIRDDNVDEEQETQLLRASSSSSTRNANSYSTVPGAASHETGAVSRGTGAASRGTGSASRGTGAASRGTGAASRGTGAASRGTGAASRGTGAASRGTGAASYGTGAASRGTGAASRGTGAASRGTGAALRGTGAASYGTGAASHGTGASSRGTAQRPATSSHSSRFNTGRRFFAPPLRNRRNATSDEAEFVTDINQFFNGADEDEDERHSIHNDRENREAGRPQRDRSNLRNVS